MSHASVADCCVVGVYDSVQATELPRAYVVLQYSVPNNKATISAIAKFVESHVVSHKQLRGGIRIVDTIPKSASGKILRRQVREWIKKEKTQEPMTARL